MLPLHRVQVSAGERPELPADPARCPPRLVGLLRRMWAQDPGRRPGAADVLKQLGIILRDEMTEPGAGAAGTAGGRQTGAAGSETNSAGGSSGLGLGGRG